jgi:hypothetical protein
MRSMHTAEIRVTAIALTMVALSGAARAQHAGAAPEPADRSVFAGSPQYPLLPRDLETELALSAAPRHLRDQASVLVLESSGYVTAKEHAGAFTCLVRASAKRSRANRAR